MIAEERLQQLTDSAIGILKGMIAIPSESFKEERVADYLERNLKLCGLNVTRLHNNLLCHHKGSLEEYRNVQENRNLQGTCKLAAPLVMLCAHIDTVAPASSYSRDPYLPAEEEGRIYGLGSNDDGGCVVSMIEAFLHLGTIGSGENLLLVLSAEEERSGPKGMDAVVKHLASLGIAPEYAIVGEPTGLRAAIGERGLLVLDGLAEGVSGHAAREEGVNALYIALEDIARLRRHAFRKVSPLMGRVKLTVTQIEAGYAHNVVPDKCSFVVDIRPTERYSNEEIWRSLQKRVKSKLTPRKLTNRSSATPAGCKLLDIINKCGIESYVSPTTSDWMRIETPAIKIGPGESARSHKADEFICRSEIMAGIELYIKILKEIEKV